MSRTAIYARKSTESDDRQVQSLDAQLHWALTRCAELGLRDPLVIKEAKSAKTPGRPEFERLMVQTNPHPLPKFRVNGPLANFPAFAQAFQCKTGDAMVRDDNARCQIW